MTILTHTSTPVVRCPAAIETLDNRTLPYTTVTCTHSEVLIDDKENSPITTHFSLINSAIYHHTTGGQIKINFGCAIVRL